MNRNVAANKTLEKFAQFPYQMLIDELAPTEHKSNYTVVFLIPDDGRDAAQMNKQLTEGTLSLE